MVAFIVHPVELALIQFTRKIAAVTPTANGNENVRPNRRWAGFAFVLALSMACIADRASAEDAVARCRAAAKPPECARAAALSHAVKKVSFWQPALSHPLEQRIGSAPPELVEFLLLDNVANNIPNEARASKLEPAFVEDVRRAWREIPAAVKRPLDKKLAGIYFMDDIGGTGFTDETVDAGGKPVAAFMILDPSVLMARTANEWATWKESSPFKADPWWTLQARIEDPARDDRVHAIQYILLHELGHVLSVASDAHPRWTVPVKESGPIEHYPFFTQSWIVTGEGFTSRFEDTFPQRRDVRFYFGAKLAGAAMLPTYEALEKTNFPTLYAATHFGDDFAEAFASYVHVVLMKRPYEIRLLRDGTLVKSYKACWSEERCAAKKAYLERFLATK